MDITQQMLLGFSSALGLGLLIGLVRERSGDGAAMAGLRTHALTSLVAAVAAVMQAPVFLVLAGVIGVLAAVAYVVNADEGKGLTSSVALLASFLLGGLAMANPALATALAVVAALLLYAKEQLHRLTRDLLSEREIFDGLLLLAAALVILPLLPDRTVDPFDVLNPAALWQLVVLLMLVSAMGHVALRVVGNRWGLAAAGFFAGYVSSTAAVMGFGQRVRESPGVIGSATAAALLSNLASVSLAFPILWTMAPESLNALLPELLACCTVLAVGGALGLRAGRADAIPPPTASSRMFKLSYVFGFTALIAVLLFISAGVATLVGPEGAMLTSIVSAAADFRVAVASLAYLSSSGAVDVGQAQLVMIGILAVSMGAKSVIAYVSGGSVYGLRVTVGQMASVVVPLLIMLVF